MDSVSILVTDRLETEKSTAGAPAAKHTGRGPYLDLVVVRLPNLGGFVLLLSPLSASIHKNNSHLFGDRSRRNR